jgi:hypothetical protein
MKNNSNTPYIRPGFYKHFKGAIYQVEGVGMHSETEEYLVSYRAPDGKKWFRPYDLFVAPAKLDDGTIVARFEYLDNGMM